MIGMKPLTRVNLLWHVFLHQKVLLLHQSCNTPAKVIALYGIRGPDLQWFKIYLSGRRQSVACNGNNSGICNISTGVPQGSTLGPFLFLIFINDIPQHIRTGSSSIFADDSAIYTTGKSFMEMKCALQSSVYDAGRWFENKNLPINITKTTCMLIATEGN